MNRKLLSVLLVQMISMVYQDFESHGNGGYDCMLLYDQVLDTWSVEGEFSIAPTWLTCVIR